MSEYTFTSGVKFSGCATEHARHECNSRTAGLNGGTSASHVATVTAGAKAPSNGQSL